MKRVFSQQADVHSRATRDKVVVDAGFEYMDDGYSGSEMTRPALEKMGLLR